MELSLLEQWHRIFDDLVDAGFDEDEAVRRADEAMPVDIAINKYTPPLRESFGLPPMRYYTFRV